MIANPVRVEGSDSTDNGGLMYAWSLQNPDIAKIITVSLGILIGADCTIRFFGPLTEHMVVFASSTLLSSAFIFVLVFSPPGCSKRHTQILFDRGWEKINHLLLTEPNKEIRITKFRKLISSLAIAVFDTNGFREHSHRLRLDGRVAHAAEYDQIDSYLQIFMKTMLNAHPGCDEILTALIMNNHELIFDLWSNQYYPAEFINELQAINDHAMKIIQNIDAMSLKLDPAHPELFLKFDYLNLKCVMNMNNKRIDRAKKSKQTFNPLTSYHAHRHFTPNDYTSAMKAIMCD